MADSGDRKGGSLLWSAIALIGGGIVGAFSFGSGGGIMSFLAPLGLALAAGAATWIGSGGGNPLEALSGLMSGKSTKPPEAVVNAEIKPLSPADEIKVDDGRGGETTYVTRGTVDATLSGKSYRLKGIVLNDEFNITEIGFSGQPDGNGAFEYRKLKAPVRMAMATGNSINVGDMFDAHAIGTIIESYNKPAELLPPGQKGVLDDTSPDDPRRKYRIHKEGDKVSIYAVVDGMENTDRNGKNIYDLMGFKILAISKLSTLHFLAKRRRR